MDCFRFVCGIAALAMGSAAFARPDINAFLNQRATSIKSLVNQARTDPEVMDRYQRHYAMTRAEVTAFLSTMRIGRMDKACVTTIYSVPPDGHIKMHYGKVREGAYVFCDLAGNPILLAKCGNPLTRGPKSPVAKNDEPELAARMSEDLRQIGEDIELPASEELVAMAPGVPGIPQDIVTVDQKPVTIIPAALGFNPLLLGFGGLPLLLGKGDDDIQINPIPEPATLAVLVVGVSLLLSRRNR